MNRHSALGALLALTLEIGIFGQAAAAIPPCAEDINGSGKAIELPTLLSEPQRIALSTVVFEALQPAPSGERPEARLRSTPACPVATFRANDDTFVLSGGRSPLPVRWVTSSTTALNFYLAPGTSGREAASLGFRDRPFALVGVVIGAEDRMRHIVRLFDGAPSDKVIQDTIIESLTTHGFVPIASYDTEGGAVSVFRGTESRIGAQLFGPVPSGQRSSAILRPDGQYFAPAGAGDAVLKDSGVTCPFALGQLTTHRMVVVEGSSEHLDLACQYSSDEVFVSIFVERLPGVDLAAEFEHQKAGMRSDYKNARDTPRLVEVKGPTRFEYGASWLGANDIAGGIWMGRRGDFVIEVDVQWKLDAYKDAREAVQRIDRLAFP